MTETAVQGATPTESYGNFGLDDYDQNTLIRAIAEMPGFDLTIIQIGGSRSS